MILQKIQRTGAIAGLCAAMAMTVPTVASATQLPDAATTWTGGPKLAAPMETAAMALPEGTIEVAQTPAQLQPPAQPQRPPQPRPTASRCACPRGHAHLQSAEGRFSRAQMSMLTLMLM